MRPWCFSDHALQGLERNSHYPTYPLTDVNTTAIQGTKVLANREIRARMLSVHEGAPARDVLARVIKYDGNEAEPRWMDIERGLIVDSVARLPSSTHGPTDKFETLCHVAADVSAAPYTSKPGRLGKICYTRKYDVVLLVGLTELKAQIRWIDSKTVRICA